MNNAVVQGALALAAGLGLPAAVALGLMANAAAAALCLLVLLCRGQWKKGLLLFAFMLAVPGAGPLYLLLGQAAALVQGLFAGEAPDLDALSFDQHRVRVILDADVQKERNVVPMEETLILSGRSSRREDFLSALKQEREGALGTIRGAVENPDQEIAHYAASYMAGLTARVKERERVLRRVFEADPGRDSCEAYARHLRDALEKGVFEGTERLRYLQRLEQAYLWQMEKTPSGCPAGSMAAMARLWLGLGDTQAAGAWIGRLRPWRYASLEAFKACAAYEFRRGDRDALAALLEGVRASSLELDGEALGWIRFFTPPKGQREGEERL